MHTITLAPGQRFHTEKGGIDHDRLIGAGEGIVVTSSKGTAYLALRPLLHDFVMSMPRGATIIYPKDAVLILGFADIAPGMRVLEAGAGSGALSCWLLRAVTATGEVTSVEKRPDFAEIAQRNVGKYFGGVPENWTLLTGALEDLAPAGPFDRVVLDMLTPWEMLPAIEAALVPGGCCASTWRPPRNCPALWRRCVPLVAGPSRRPLKPCIADGMSRDLPFAPTIAWWATRVSCSTAAGSPRA